tara:strand:+ start:271 stop:480 length:210 start_codon:yes stop_codon:yes gene_type:complete
MDKIGDYIMANPKRRKTRKTMKAIRARAPEDVVDIPVIPAPPVGVAPKIVEPVTKKAARKPKKKVKAKE